MNRPNNRLVPGAHTAPLRYMLRLVVAATLAACGSDETSPDSDSGSDGGTDTDVSTDAADTASDATDGSSDPDTDAGTDADADPDTDAGTDAGTDTDAGPDTGDGSGALACEGLTYVGDDAWPARLVVASGATLCAYPGHEWYSEGEESFEQALSRNFALDRASKGVITVEAGTWPLPTESTETPFGLPMCATGADGSSEAVGAASSVTAEVFDGIGMLPGNHVRARMTLGSQDLEVTITRGLDTDTAELGVTAATDHQLGVSARLGGERLYADCNLAPNSCNEVSVPEHGTLFVAMHTWASSPGLGLAVTREISGTWEGESFAVSSYESLQTVYGHHAFDRHAFVRFDAPIGAACGLRVTDNLGEWTVAEADCDGNPVGEFFAATATLVDCMR